MHSLNCVPNSLVGLMILLATFALAGCKGNEVRNIPFETIERADFSETGEYYEDEGPKLVIISSKAEINPLGDTVSTDAQAQLQDIDFDEYFVIAVFQGWRPVIPSPQSGVEIQKISRRGNTITIYARFYEPVEDHEVKNLVSSPYHLVKVHKGEGIQGEFEFVLNVDGDEVVNQVQFVP